MKDILYIFLHSDGGSDVNNWALLVFRILVAVELFRVHGMKKLRGNDGKLEIVPNPLGLPQALNNLVATFSDIMVPALLILGIATRLVILPTIGVTAIGYFVVHRKAPLAIREVPYMYTVILLYLLVTGPGTIAVDHYLLPFFTNN
jgi:putative oxidoreductase